GGAIGAHDQHPLRQYLPHVGGMLHCRRPYQHGAATAFQRGAQFRRSHHSVLGCQRATAGRDMLPGRRGKGNRCAPRPCAAMVSRMSDGLSANLQYLEASATVAISQEAKRRKAAGEDVIDLGAGEPDFPTPSIPAEAGIRAIKDGKTHYSANEGILELRAAAATHLSLLSGGRPVNADHIVVSNGSKQSLFNACFTLFGPGDVVAI